MKKLVLFLLMLCTIQIVYSKTVTFRFQEGIGEGWLKDTMECRISALLTEINDASNANRPLALSGLNMTERSRRSLESQWVNIHFVCEDAENVASCFVDMYSYEVRGIPVSVKPLDTDDAEEQYKELVIRFDKNGLITSVHLALQKRSSVLYGDNNDISDRHKREIWNFLEEYNSFYTEKDIVALNDFFGYKPYYISAQGFRCIREERDVLVPHEEKRIKEKLLKDIAEAFARKQHFNLQFDSIKIIQHMIKRGFYGVSFRQELSYDGFKDSGYVFILWEFFENNEARAGIHARSWQPEWGPYGPNGSFRKIKDEEILTLNDFFIP